MKLTFPDCGSLKTSDTSSHDKNKSEKLLCKTAKMFVCVYCYPSTMIHHKMLLEKDAFKGF